MLRWQKKNVSEQICWLPGRLTLRNRNVEMLTTQTELEFALKILELCDLEDLWVPEGLWCQHKKSEISWNVYVT